MYVLQMHFLQPVSLLVCAFTVNHCCCDLKYLIVWFGVIVRGIALFIHTVLPASTLDFSISHMDEAGREALTSHKLLTVKSSKSQVVWFLLNKATAIELCCSMGIQQ